MVEMTKMVEIIKPGICGSTDINYSTKSFKLHKIWQNIGLHKINTTNTSQSSILQQHRCDLIVILVAIWLKPPNAAICQPRVVVAPLPPPILKVAHAAAELGESAHDAQKEFLLIIQSQPESDAVDEATIIVQTDHSASACPHAGSVV